jgi:hypothetical protein
MAILIHNCNIWLLCIDLFRLPFPHALCCYMAHVQQLSLLLRSINPTNLSLSLVHTPKSYLFLSLVVGGKHISQLSYWEGWSNGNVLDLYSGGAWFGWDINYHDIYCGFPHSLHGNASTVPQLGCGHFASNPFSLINLPAVCHYIF